MNHSELIERHKLKLGVAVAIIGILAIPLLLLRYVGDIGVEMAAVIMTGLLTLALVVLYFQQYRLMDQQTALMEQRYTSDLAYRGQVVADDDVIYVDLKNTGRGVIKFMYLECDIDDSEFDLTIEPAHDQLHRISDKDFHLESFSEFKTFKGKCNLHVQEWDDEDKDRLGVFPFSFISSRLARRGVEKCRITLTILVVDENAPSDGASYELPIGEQTVTLEQPKEVEVEQDSETKTIKMPSTSISEGLSSKYPQDIVPINHPFKPVNNLVDSEFLEEEIEE